MDRLVFAISSCLTPLEARVIWEALDQFVQNGEDHIETSEDVSEQELNNVEVAQQILDRINLALSIIAEE